MRHDTLSWAGRRMNVLDHKNFTFTDAGFRAEADNNFYIQFAKDRMKKRQPDLLDLLIISVGMAFRTCICERRANRHQDVTVTMIGKPQLDCRWWVF